MSYVDAYLNRDKDTINIVERVNGKRVYKSYPTCYRFYYEDKDGPYKSIYCLLYTSPSPRDRG